MTEPKVLYLHKRDLTPEDRAKIALARMSQLHAKASAMVALYKAREVLKEIANEVGHEQA